VGCTNANGTFSLVAEAITVNVDTQVETVLAYSIQNGVNEGSVQPVGMPDWTATPVYTFNTGSIEDIARVGWYGALVVGDLWYWIADGQQYEDTTAPYEFQIYTAAGRGTPAMSQAYHYEFMDFPADPDDFVAYTDREFQGARPSNWNLDLAAGLLPRFGHPSGFVEDLTHDALMVTVNTDGNAAFDGGRVNFDWDFGLHSWTIVFPGPDREFAAPPEPWIDVDIQLPGWLNYWPNLNDTIRGRGGNIDEATFVGDWDQYKFFYVGEGAFPTTGYTWRSSWLFSFFIIKGDQFPGKLSNGKPSIFPGWRAAR